jgi:hypothetical protein
MSLNDHLRDRDHENPLLEESAWEDRLTRHSRHSIENLRNFSTDRYSGIVPMGPDGDELPKKLDVNDAEALKW